MHNNHVHSNCSMALLKYLVSKNGLPNPRGLLSTDNPPHVISQMNSEVVNATDTSNASSKRGSYKQ